MRRLWPRLVRSACLRCRAVNPGPTDQAATPRGALSRLTVVVGLLTLLAISIGGFVLAGFIAAEKPIEPPGAHESFNWEVASVFGTAVGTVLLALATGFLALQTRESVAAARDELTVTREALQGGLRPLIISAPPNVFMVEEQADFRWLEQGQQLTRFLRDQGKISVTANQYSSARRQGAIVYAEVVLPVRNVGSGVALIESVPHRVRPGLGRSRMGRDENPSSRAPGRTNPAWFLDGTRPRGRDGDASWTPSKLQDRVRR